MKHRGLLIFGWFAVLVIYNAASHWPENVGKSLTFLLLQAISYLTSLPELIVSAVVISAIVSSKRKPMRES